MSPQPGQSEIMGNIDGNNMERFDFDLDSLAWKSRLQQRQALPPPAAGSGWPGSAGSGD